MTDFGSGDRGDDGSKILAVTRQVFGESPSGSIERGLDDETVVIRIVDQSGVGTSRRVARSMAASVHLGRDKTEKLALAVSEAAMNQLRHARGGEILLSRLRDDDLPDSDVPGGPVGQAGGGVEMLAVDDGPGIVKLGLALREASQREEGRSTQGLGIGLGSIRRLSDEFAIHAPPGIGTVVLARFWHGRNGNHSADGAAEFSEPFAPQIGAVSRARRGQAVCGDAWRLRRTGEHTYHLMVVDGLGHGRVAAIASRAALEGLRDVKAGTPPVDVLRAAHEAAKGTRGAAAMVLRLRTLNGEIDVSGVGNVQGAVWAGDRWKGIASQPGTLGVATIRIRQTTYSLATGDPFVVHTDGLSSKWLLDEFPGMRRLHPSLVAASLYRDFGHDHDDSTVFVGRIAGHSALL